MSKGTTYKDVMVCSQMDHEYKEKVEGEWIVFAPREKKKMNRYEAAMFLGTYAGQNVVKAFKIEPILDNTEDSKKFVCSLTGKEFTNKEDYDRHIEGFRKRLGITSKELAQQKA